MNKNFWKISRIITVAILLLMVTITLVSYRTSNAAFTQSPDSAGAEGASLVSTTGQGVSLFSDALQNGPPEPDPELMRQLRASARGQVAASAKNSTGVASFVRVSRGGDLHPASQGKSPNGKAADFMSDYGGLFGVSNAASELVQVSTQNDQYGATHLTYQQVYNGVPVFAGVLRMHVDSSGALTAVNGEFVPDISLNTTPALDAQAAADLATEAVLSKPLSDDDITGAPLSPSADEIYIESNTLYVYQDGLIQNVSGPKMLVYEVVVTNGGSVREVLFVNAHSGKIVNRYSASQDALFRRLFEMNTATQVWQEGDPFPGALTGDQQNIVNYSGDSYYYFFNAFGIDSYNGAGAEMQSVNNDPRINCPNANWNGITTNYCNGVTADDVVAHEWGHAYTEYTSNLIYQWQSGALNEAYSDIWGETVDLLNGAGTDDPSTVRSVGVCSIYTTPVPSLRINSPASIAGEYQAGGASFGPPLSSPGITGDVILADDGAGVTSDACTPLVNGAAISGNVALVDRGACAFTIKVKNAQNAGATGVIVADNVPGPAAGMAGTDATITIPSLRVTLDTGNLIKGELAGGVNATLTVVGGAAPENSYRWLQGEDATAFGSAIRDLWAPTCKSDPGKVSDAEYHCATSDGGGVHTNSGVPNHGYALLVDGGTYNGQTINAIGMVKASHLYWRAQSVYQTPTTNFNDHADALEAACTDLVGVPLEGLSTTSTPAGPSGQTISAADCGEVTKMIAAVELRTDPSAQCNFQPILQPDPPPVCTTGHPVKFFNEQFSSLSQWTLSNQGVFSGWPGIDWSRSKTLPTGLNGKAAFAADPDAGNCDGGAGDISGMMSMESPPIEIFADMQVVPRVVFEHYIATEAGWDGGNVKISINGGPYTVIPASAFVFNPYNTILQTAGAGNTNPLAGQPGFSGTDGGQLGGSWGESQIDLALLGVQIGDTIRLRFDFGVDGCTGIDGWYVDKLELIACKAP